MKIIDLRSDTVTRPTPRMRRAMAEAEVGDDVYLEDPTVEKLQERAAELFEREAALFVPTGSMGNLIAVKLHTRPGDEVILDSRSHILNYELGSLAAIAGVVPRAITTVTGHLRWPQIEDCIRPNIYYCAQTRLVCLENTHNMAGGTVMSAKETHEIVASAHARGLAVHLDGARIFNAATYLNLPVAKLADRCDSIMFCLSKGLGAPAGSLLVASRDFIEQARRVRKMLGGGMRQVGVLAAAGLVALEESPAKLAEDHLNARFLAEELLQLNGIKLHLESVQTNIVIFDISGTGLTSAELSAKLKENGVLINGISHTQMRIVTHYDINRNDCKQALSIIRKVLKNSQSY
ncbi:MAG: GntG family PLP-dependent aldolase [Acidobacteriota bacterium]|nr:aminotransferase class I/II-fold pyridoxal phosphate-dependent enzyme [Blastocatellia bacterium]MDW8412611.1 GntG family PLP-dependent aldolase [Acidobacteriota bacterium]